MSNLLLLKKLPQLGIKWSFNGRNVLYCSFTLSRHFFGCISSINLPELGWNLSSPKEFNGLLCWMSEQIKYCLCEIHLLAPAV